MKPINNKKVKPSANIARCEFPPDLERWSSDTVFEVGLVMQAVIDPQSLFAQFDPLLCFDSPRPVHEPIPGSHEGEETWYIVAEQSVPASVDHFWNTIVCFLISSFTFVRNPSHCLRMAKKRNAGQWNHNTSFRLLKKPFRSKTLAVVSCDDLCRNGSPKTRLWTSV